MYWGSLLLIGLPAFLLLEWLHQRIFGSAAGFVLGWLYFGVGYALSWLVRFVGHLVWDAITMKPDPR